MVLHRRAGEAQAMACIESADQLRRLCRGILDSLRFVEHCHMPFGREQVLGVARQQSIGRYHQVGIVDLGKAVRAIGAVQRQNPQLGSQSRRLGEPVRHDASRTDDEAGAVEAACALFDEEMCQRLNSLA